MGCFRAEKCKKVVQSIAQNNLIFIKKTASNEKFLAR